MQPFEKLSVLVLPGREGAGAGHWQTLWEMAFPEFVRVQQSDWVHPVYSEWEKQLTIAIRSATKPVLLIAHSAATSLTMRWAFDQPELARRIAGAFLVAPTDRDVLEGSSNNPVRGFGPMLLRPLPFKSMVVASRNDPYVSVHRARIFANAWQATWVDAGNKGHFDMEAQLGVWPQGLVALGQFMSSL